MYLYEASVGLFGLVGCGLLALYVFQSKLLYYPQIPQGSRTQFMDHKDYFHESVFEEVFFSTKDGLKLQGYLVKQPKSDETYTMIFFHGNAGNLSYRLPNMKELYHRLGVNVFIVSYRGYGKSEGSPHEEGLKIDAEAALEYIMSKPEVNADKILLFGRSLGGAVAVSLASNPKYKSHIKGLIVENSFTSIPDMVDVVFPALSSVKWLATNKWESKHAIDKVEVPTLFLSGLKDSLVPSKHMADLHSRAENAKFKMLATFEHGDHMDLWVQRGYYDAIQAFIDKL